MRHTGIIRRIDDLGRVVIPKNVRAELGIDEDDPLEISVSEDSIVLEKYYPEIAMASDDYKELLAYRAAAPLEHVQELVKAKQEGRLVLIPSNSDCSMCELECGDCGNCMRYGYGRDTQRHCSERINGI